MAGQRLAQQARFGPVDRPAANAIDDPRRRRRLGLAGVGAEFGQIERLHAATLEEPIEVGRHAGREQLPEQVSQLHEARPRLHVGRHRQVRLARECLPDQSSEYRLRADLHEHPRAGRVHGRDLVGESHWRDEVFGQLASDRGGFVRMRRGGGVRVDRLARRGELRLTECGRERLLRPGDERRVEPTRHRDALRREYWPTGAFRPPA